MVLPSLCGLSPIQVSCVVWKATTVECEECELERVRMKSTRFLMSQGPAWLWSQMMNKEVRGCFYAFSTRVSAHKFYCKNKSYTKNLKHKVIV